jgi:hypothetical protein
MLLQQKSNGKLNSMNEGSFAKINPPRFGFHGNFEKLNDLRESSTLYPSALHQVDSLSNQLPNPNFRDTKINENVLLSGPPNVDSDSEFNRGSSMMGYPIKKKEKFKK